MESPEPDIATLTLASPPPILKRGGADTHSNSRPASPALRRTAPNGSGSGHGGSGSSHRATPVFGEPAQAAAEAASAAAATGSALKLDMGVGAAVTALVHHLVQPLAAHYPHAEIMSLRTRLTDELTAMFRPTWNESNPHSGSGARSLISDRVLGFPAVLRRAAEGSAIDLGVWSKSIVSTRRRKAENEDEEAEWEVWCDPGMVVWRWGGWGWDEVEFDPIKRPRESFQIIWQAAPTPVDQESDSPPPVTAPLRQSKAIPIRAPSLTNPAAATNTTVLNSPAPISRASSPAALLPVVDLTSTGSGGGSKRRDYGDIGLDQTFRPNGHKGTDSTSSHSSDSSDTTNSHQLLTPALRPGSADLMPEAQRERSASGKLEDDSETRSREGTPEGDARSREVTPESDPPSRRNTPVTTPTVIPYDGGNVTVLGGGTKLGGSRPPSASLRAGDRTRSPSLSIASRALSNAVGPNSNGGAGGGAPGSPRKHRPRRRIMPTYLGHFGQPGIGAPMMGAFGMQAVKTGQPGYGWPHGQPGAGASVGVGVGVAPPPVSGASLAAQMGLAVGSGKRLAS